MKALNDHSREKIRSLRKKQGMTLKALAQNINCSAGYLSRVETGVVNPSLATLLEIARYLAKPENKPENSVILVALGGHGQHAELAAHPVLGAQLRLGGDQRLLGPDPRVDLGEQVFPDLQVQGNPRFPFKNHGASFPSSGFGPVNPSMPPR